MQEEHHDQSNKQHGKHQVMLYSRNSLNRKGRGVLRDIERKVPVTVERCKPGERCPCKAAHVNRVGIALFHDHNSDSAPSVYPRQGCDLLETILDFGNIPKCYRTSSGGAQNKRFQLFKVRELASKPNHKLPVAVINFSGRKIKIGLADLFEYIGNGQVVTLEPFQIDIDPDFPFTSSKQINLTHTGNTCKLRLDIILEHLVKVCIRQR